jgi:hypothetical protein
MTWQEAVRRAAEGGCPLLKCEQGEWISLAVENQNKQRLSHEADDNPIWVLLPMRDNVSNLTAVLVALAWYWDKTDECTDNEYSAYMESIRSLRARRAELEKELAK